MINKSKVIKLAAIMAVAAVGAVGLSGCTDEERCTGSQIYGGTDCRNQSSLEQRAPAKQGLGGNTANAL